MARFYVSISRLSRRCLLHTSSSGKPIKQTSHEDMNFMKAAEILFSETPRRKKFGWDFHLWQFFVACLPSFAVYLTAQYARHEMRRMEKERDLAAEEKAKALMAEEADSISEGSSVSITQKPGADAVFSNDSAVNTPIKKENGNSTELLKIKARLDAMEEKVKEIESAKARDATVSRQIESMKGTDESDLSSAQLGPKAQQTVTSDSMVNVDSNVSQDTSSNNKKREGVDIERPQPEGNSEK